MTQHGGISTLTGVRYEVQFGVYKIPDLLEGHLSAIRYQPLTSAISPNQLPQKTFVDDYLVQDAKGDKSFFQVKQNAKDASWTINRLINEGVLDQFWNQHCSEPQSNKVFVSNIPAPRLRNLADLARRSTSLVEFEQTLSRQMKSDSERIIKKLGIAMQDLWSLMKAVDFNLLIEEQTRTRIADYAAERYSDPDKFALVLKALIETSAGHALTRDIVIKHLEDNKLFRLPISLTRDVQEIFRQASGSLRAYKSDILGVHIPRKETEELEQWIKTTVKECPVAFLLDVAGTGKSVILHDLLEKLENQAMPVLAVKADSLIGITNAVALQAKLNLPASPESLLAAAARNTIAVLLIDQLDALSLTFSRNQDCLSTIIDLIGRAISIPNVRVVVSCRSFDRKFDPVLKQIRSTDEFSIKPLDKSQIEQVLDRLGVAWEELTSREQNLLTNPHHLETFASVVDEVDKRGITRHSVSTVQDLYNSLWDTKIINPGASSVSANQLQVGIYRLVEAIHRSQELQQPVSLLDDMPGVRIYMESGGILRREGASLMFFHQSFFDYCYARRFVLQNTSLAEEIRKGDQGFFVRPQVIQVVTYLRVANKKRYYSELEALMDRGQIREWLRRLKRALGALRRALFATGVRIFGPPIRFHLRHLVFAIFGQQTNLEQREKAIGLSCLRSSRDRYLFLLGSHGNAEWFDVIRPELTTLLALPSESLDGEVIPFLRSVQEDRSDEVYGFFINQLGSSDKWEARIVWCLNGYKAWRSGEARKCLIWLCENGQNPWDTLELALYNVAKANPTLGCEALKIILDRLRDQWVKLERPPVAEECSQPNSSTDKNGFLSYVGHLRDFENYGQKLLPARLLWIEELVKQAGSSCPGTLLEILLPWLEEVLPNLTWRFAPQGWLRDVVFSSPSVHDFHSPDSAIIQGIRLSLSQLAKTDPKQFLSVASRIAEWRYLILHTILAEVLTEHASIYASWALDYLLKDALRFQIGDMASTTLFSRKLIGAILPHLSPYERAQLEEVILSYYPDWETKPENRRFRGSDQLELLWEVPDSLLTQKGQKVRRELRRKFEDYKPPELQDIKFTAVTSPVPEDKTHLLSDDDWLNAMRHYNDETGWGKPREEMLKGGVIELSRAFQNVVKAEPERFDRLARRFDQSVSSHYFEAILSGLAESTVPSNIVFETCEYLYGRRPDDVMIQSAVCNTIEKRVDEDVPHSLIEIVRNIALHSTDPDYEKWQIMDADGNYYYDGDPHFNGINTARGKAVRVYMKCMLTSSSLDTELLFTTLEQFASDSSSSVRSCLIEFLPYALRFNTRRIVAIFNQAVKGRPELLACDVSSNFMHYAMGYHAAEMLKHIETLMVSDAEKVREAAGRLVAIAYLIVPDGKTLYRRCMRGDTALRRGVAKVLARNVDQPNLLQKCLTGLTKLMDDSDKNVREHVGEVFEYLPSPTRPIKRFINAFLHSQSIFDAPRNVMRYAEHIHLEHPEMAMTIGERIQSALGIDIVDIQKATALLDDDLVNLAISIQTHSTDPALKSRAMDLFERVMELGSHYARKALEAINR